MIKVKTKWEAQIYSKYNKRATTATWRKGDNKPRWYPSYCYIASSLFFPLSLLDEGFVFALWECPKDDEALYKSHIISCHAPAPGPGPGTPCSSQPAPQQLICVPRLFMPKPIGSLCQSGHCLCVFPFCPVPTKLNFKARGGRQPLDHYVLTSPHPLVPCPSPAFAAQEPANILLMSANFIYLWFVLYYNILEQLKLYNGPFHAPPLASPSLSPGSTLVPNSNMAAVLLDGSLFGRIFRSFSVKCRCICIMIYWLCHLMFLFIAQTLQREREKSSTAFS